MSVDVNNELMALCDSTLATLPEGRVRSAVEVVRTNLGRPLQVTVAGGVSSGKSTLVNALLGQRVAAVDAGECTRVVTRFTYSHHERTEVVLTDGSSRNLAMRDGTLPSELGVPVDQVREVVVHLSNRGLQQLAIVDTPGLNTVTESNQAQTEGFLGLAADSRAGRDTAASIGQADALVFLMPNMRQSDVDVLTGFRDLYAGAGLSAFNAVAVLSKIDQLSRTADPLVAAEPIARRVADEAKGLVSSVLPVIGLLAETSACARLDEDDARALEELAAFGDDLDREDLLLSPDAFMAHTGASVDVATRRRLFERLGLYGLQVALTAIDDGARGAAALMRLLDRSSGLEPLRSHVMERLGAQADLLKAHSALSDLRRLSYMRDVDPAEQAVLRGLRSPLDRFEMDPTLHRLKVAEVLQDASTGAFRLPENLLRDLERLASASDPVRRTGAASPVDVADAALRGAALWGRFANDPRRSPVDVRRARAVKEAYEMLWGEAQARSAV
ncbi:MAG: dynamin family protein [Acidimicrobiales bacterium]|nr:dynamin family protein [Acidimicrobiales bacterium]